MNNFLCLCVFCLIFGLHANALLNTNPKNEELYGLWSNDGDNSPELLPRNDKLLVTTSHWPPAKNSGKNTNTKSSNEFQKVKRSISEETYINFLFETYGTTDNINVTGFKKILEHLGLENIIQLSINHKVESHDENVDLNAEHHIHNGKECHLSYDFGKDFTIENKTDQNKNKTNLSTSSNTTIDHGNINKTGLNKLCPVLLYYLLQPNVCEKHPLPKASESNKLLAWLYASVSVLIISLCGLLGVFVIPFMDKKFYQQLIQFLVALAVGTLCGDALLHLLPHAMVPHDDHSHEHSSVNSMHHVNHTDTMWKGLIALLGLLFFFFTEKVLSLCGEWRKKKQRSQNKLSNVEIMPSTMKKVGDTSGKKTCKHTYSTYPYCYDDIKNIRDGLENEEKNEKPSTSSHVHSSNDNHIEPQLEENHLDHNHLLIKRASLRYADDTVDVEESQNLTEEAVEREQTERPSVSSGVVFIEKGEKVQVIESEDKKDEYRVILREHESSSHHGHSHAHGHVHSPPRSMSSVAWMVILGDGLHNFTDGMTIGAAFANNITGGCSTAVAVFCHELPHELGDFAVLLKAGMSARQAVFYNLLTSILSYFGMCLGIMVGDIPELSSWVFALAAGMFLYIGLVDMFPELTTSHSDGALLLCQCSLQGLGLTTGIALMLLIAYYEDHLKNIF